MKNSEVRMDARYFIEKFEAIPDELWTEGKLFRPETGACCALGHCGVRGYHGLDKNSEYYSGETFTDEGEALCKLLGDTTTVYAINDLLYPEYNTAKTPKGRILNELRKLINE